MSLEYDFAGVHAAITTPFDPETGAVDLDALTAHATWLLANGIEGLVVCSTLGESDSLDRDERRAVVETVAGVAAGRAKLIVGVSAPDFRSAGEHAQHAASVGADGVLLLPPTNHAPTSMELVDHYRSVAQYDVPVIVDADPSAAHIDLTPELIEELGRLDGIAAVKESSGDVRRQTEIGERAPHLQRLCGTDDVALESALMGAHGWIGAFTGVLPLETKSLFQLGRLGQVERARSMYWRMLPLLRWDSRTRSVEAIKCALEHLGLPGGGPPRPPRRVVDEIEREIIAQQVARARSAVA